MAIGKEGNVKWVDGLRGIASFLVVVTHICRAFEGTVFAPALSENGPSSLLQLPFVRVGPQGRIGVTIFAMVTGYVCALKPIRLSRTGNQASSFTSVGKSALRRVPRLVLPTTFSTILIWMLANLGAFTIGNRCSSWWTNNTSPDLPPTMYENVATLMYNLMTPWTRASNIFEENQWTLLPLLKCSFWVYVFILATSYVMPRYRMALAAIAFFYFWMCGDATFGMPCFFGVWLCELQNMPEALAFVRDRTKLCKVLSPLLIIFGLWIGSHPEGRSDWASWSKNQAYYFRMITIENADLGRFSSCWGIMFISLGLHFSPFMCDILSNQYFLWLGKNSFAVYLLHGTLMRTVLAWMLYGFSVPADITNEKGEITHPKIPYPGGTRLLICLPFWFPLNYLAAHAWTTWVDPFCARLTERFVSHILPPPEEKPRSLLPS